jgi:hypothetical protein
VITVAICGGDHGSPLAGYCFGGIQLATKPSGVPVCSLDRRRCVGVMGVGSPSITVTLFVAALDALHAFEPYHASSLSALRSVSEHLTVLQVLETNRERIAGGHGQDDRG